MTEIVRYVNESVPGAWYQVDASFFAAFPLDILSKLPIDILLYHEFYCLIPESQLIEYDNITYSDLGVNCNNISYFDDVALCSDPFVETKRWFPES